MTWVWNGSGYTYTYNATCVNIDDLKGVVTITFITQLVGMILTIISSGLICASHWQPLCCRRKNRISPEEFAEMYGEFIQTYRTSENNQRV
jgi:hypothetical protein